MKILLENEGWFGLLVTASDVFCFVHTGSSGPGSWRSWLYKGFFLSLVWLHEGTETISSMTCCTEILKFGKHFDMQLQVVD